MKLRGEGLFVSAVAVGVLLRSWLLGQQILADDEWHAVHIAVRMDWPDLLRSFPERDRWHHLPLARPELRMRYIPPFS